MVKKVIVVGGTRGIGRELVRQLAKRGDRVVAIGRKQDKLDSLLQEFPEKVHGIVHDVTHYTEAERTFRAACDWLGGLDLIIYSSGVLERVEWEEFDFAKDEPMIDVNCKGAVAWLNLAAQRFQGTGRGTIIGIGSVAGDRGRGNAPIYNASKAFLHTYLEALRNRLSRHGVNVVTIKPGPVDTEMTAGLSLSKALTAEDAARRILRAERRNAEVYLVSTHKLIFAVLRAVPSFIFRRLKI